MFSQIMAGNSVSSVVSYLNKLNYRTRDGNLFTKQSVEDKLRNVIYTGKYVYNKADGKKNRKRLFSV